MTKILKFKDLKKIEMAYTLDSILMEKDMEKGNFFGSMAKSLKDSGKMVKRMGLEPGNLQKEITMKEIGCKIGKVEKVITFT